MTVTRIWSSTGSTDMNLTSNYDGTGSFATDDLLFNSTSVVNAAATANIICNSITIANTYSGTWALTGYTATMAQGFSDSGITGAHNYGNGITCNGASASMVVNTGSTKTTSNCVVTMNGTTGMTFTCNVSGQIFNALVLGASAVVTTTGSLFWFSVTSGIPLTMGNNSTLTCNATVTYIRANYDGGIFTSIGTGCTINGTSSLVFILSLIAKKASLPALTCTGTGNVFVQSNTGLNEIDLSGDLSVAARFYVGSVGAAYQMGFDTKDYNVTCGNLYVAASASGGSYYNWGDSTVTCTSFDHATSGGTNTMDMSTSTWNVAGYYQMLNTNTTYSVGTYKCNITNTATITTSGKTCFYDLTLNANTKNISLVDPLTCHNLTHTAGNFNQNSKAITCTGDATLNSSGTNTYNAAWTVDGNLIWGSASTGTKTGMTASIGGNFNTGAKGIMYSGPGSLIYAAGNVQITEPGWAAIPKMEIVPYQ